MNLHLEDILGSVEDHVPLISSTTQSSVSLPNGQDMPGLAVGDAVLISQTRRETMIICQPQQRNTAGRMFGGYLMRSLGTSG